MLVHISIDLLEFYQEITVLFSTPNKQSYELTVLINSAYFSICLWLSVSQYFVCLFIIILMSCQSCTESNIKPVRRSQQATGRNKKHTKSSGSVQKLLKVSRISRKAQHQNNNKQTYKIQWL